MRFSQGGGESCSCTTDRGEFDPDPEAHSGHTGVQHTKQHAPFVWIKTDQDPDISPRQARDEQKESSTRRGCGLSVQSCIAGPSGAQLGGLFECIEASWASVARTEYVYGNFAWTGTCATLSMMQSLKRICRMRARAPITVHCK
jgi:hypothetical protein